MSLTVLLIIVLVILLVGGLPQWGYVGSYAPSGLLGIVLVVLLILLLLGKI